MAPRYSNRVEKKWKWAVNQLQRTISLDSEEAQNQVAEILKKLEDEKDAPQPLAARDLTFDRVVEIFGLKESQAWDLQKEDYDVPASLTFVLELIKHAPYDKNSEAYNRLAIDYLIIACFAKHKQNLSKQPKKSTNNPNSATSPILKQSELPINDPHDQIAPTTLSKAPESTSQPTNGSYDQIAPTTLSKAPEKMSLSVQVEEKGGKKWLISGIADWAMGYGNRAALEDRAVLLAVEAKREDLYSGAEGQLLAYLATIRQLRIQANKENVMTQGFYSDGRRYTFICIRNDGTVMRSESYDTSFKRNLKPVFNFLLGMLITAANSSPNTSPIKPGKERDEKIKNLDWDVFVRVVKDTDDDTDSVEEDESCRLWITEVI
ncbi:hypothetical protein EG329_002449 [Mollisiaceae sp. DMI_Dod_QoI]|nr:hypothetical protein EG329_002449 [Helotiales sp. DMI_Dod_QoI]